MDQGSTQNQIKVVSLDRLTNIRAEAIKDLIHCLAFFGTTNSLMFTTNSKSDDFCRLVGSQKFKDAIKSNIETLFDLFNRWNPTAFPLKIYSSGSPFDLKSKVTKQFGVRTIYDTNLRFRNGGLVSTWNGRIAKVMKKKNRFIHHFACLAPFMLFPESHTIECDDGCAGFVEISRGQTFSNFKTYSLHMKLPATPTQTSNGGQLSGKSEDR